LKSAIREVWSWLRSNFHGLDMEKQVLVLGSTPAGIQAACELADLGLQVHLLETSPFIGEDWDLPPYLKNSRILEILKHPRITVWTNTELVNLSRRDGGFLAEIRQNPRYVDLQKCTACGDCLEVCPVTIPGTGQKAIHFGGQPGCAVISKGGMSPCSNACPAGIHVQGYTALVGQGRYREAYQLIHEALPFPSVCGRVCNHYCEAACTRGKVDQAVNLMALKRYVADWAQDHQTGLLDLDDSPQLNITGKRVAIIGAGPAGLTAARDLVRKGHAVTVFDNQPRAGGMMRVGIPPHRISYHLLEWEINQILAEGVDLQLNTWIDDIPGLLTRGWDAVLIATGAHRTVKIPIEGAEHPDNWLSLDFLKEVCLGDGPDLSGRNIIVLGGGDVAMDAARSAIRLGPTRVRVICRGLRASFNEVQEAEEEGVEIIRGRVFKRIILGQGAITGVECLEAEVGEVVDGKRQFKELPGTEHVIPGDLVIWALGQEPDFSFLPDQGQISVSSPQGIQADAGMMTTLDGVFTAGDVRRGTTFFVVDAVGEGHAAAVSIDRYLMGMSSSGESADRQEVSMTREDVLVRLDQSRTGAIKRARIPKLPVQKRGNNFREVDLTLSEDAVLREASRCLACGPCSECMACLEVCQPGAVIHHQTSSTATLSVSAVIGGEDFSPPQIQPDIITLAAPTPLAGSAAAYQALLGSILDLPEPVNPLPLETRKRDLQWRTGLILCQCGGEISSALDTTKICQDALTWPEISFSTELPFSCTDLGAAAIKAIARENKLDRVILAACSCCSLDQVCFSCTYQRTRCRKNLGLFSSPGISFQVELVNIREQCAWAHPRGRKKATAAARVLIHSALARFPGRANGRSTSAPKPTSILIVGNGDSGRYCQESLIKLGLIPEMVEVMAGEIIRTGGRYLAEWPGGYFRADILVLAPGSGAELDHISRSVMLANQGHLISGTSGGRDLGLFICSPELAPQVSGEGTAAGIFSWIRKISGRINQPAAVVDPARCRACGTCQEVCGYGLPELIKDPAGTRAYINPLLCFDCGTCSAQCPSGAISPGSHPVTELENMLDMILG
jgi:NADPH-dependent glutamate synthase beta subunit-like oxidoreductase/NAD-dependent dihydropyrimidine dehydrogenase PreA subunit